MFKFLSHKLLNKKWLNACLLLGIVLLVAVASCNPMFKNGAMDMLISAKFDSAIEDNNAYSSVIGRTGSCATDECADTSAVDNKIKAYQNRWLSYLEVPVLETQTRMWLEGSYATTNLGDRRYLDIDYLEDMEDHINIAFGAGLHDGTEEAGTYPCVLSQEFMDTYDLVVGEVLSFDKITDASGNPLKMTIVGIYEPADNSDIYWNEVPSTFEKMVFVGQEAFDEIISSYDYLSIYYNTNLMLDYSGIDHSNASDIRYYIKAFEQADSGFSQNFSDILGEYESDSKSIMIIIWVLELPILVLLLSFIYMVSSQILEMEDGEIAMLKSRGTSTKQILGIYLGESTILSVIAIVIGIPIGYLLCKLCASATSFLKFSVVDTHFYTLDIGMLLYSLAAAVVAILFITLPVVKYAKNSIVEQKSKTGKVNAKPLWEKAFLDIILVAVSIYLLYNYNKQKSDIALSILSGNKPDPLIFLNSSLFIFAVGLLVLRLIKYLIKLIYFMGRKKWSPAVYASFLQITRTVKKQGFISVFLVMTIAMGMFNSNMARTINENNQERLEYNLGTDLVIDEYWARGNYIDTQKVAHWYYNEPDFERYSDMVGTLCDSATRVIYDDNTTIKTGGTELPNSILMAINTKEFGETAELQDGLNETHWFNYLNDIATVSNGVIISSNLAEKYKLEVGDSINYARYNPIKSKSDEEIASVSGTICAIVDAWPGFNQYTYETDEDGNTVETERYLVVANYAYVVSAFGQTPYQVWMRLAEGHDYTEVLDNINEQGIRLNSYESLDKNVREMLESPLVLITNGLFSLSFLVAVILCTVGFLIYWITSIKQRELLFGIYRAMGMSMKEINKMLINEQMFSSVLASLAGYGVGAAATALFVKLVAIVYLPETHNIAISITVNPFDIVKLTIVVIFMFVLCFLIIRTILKKMNITQALKLGED
jgi:putative ABC transport system permease protein